MWALELGLQKGLVLVFVFWVEGETNSHAKKCLKFVSSEVASGAPEGL